MFHFKNFSLQQSEMVFKIGTDAMVLGALIECQVAPKNVLDIGSGTGVLSVFCAHRFPNASITSLDINDDAVALANENFKTNGFELRVKAIKCAVQEFVSVEKFDLIVSNPPYFEMSTKSNEKYLEQARHQDGMSNEDLLKSVTNLLNENGIFYLILPFEAEKKVDELLFKFNLSLKSKQEIHALPDQRWRIVFEIEKLKMSNMSLLAKQGITIRNKNGSYHNSYKENCGHFHDRPIE